MIFQKLWREYVFLSYLNTFWAFTVYLFKRLAHDRLTMTAGSMAYVTLLSLVPLLTVILAALSVIPEFANSGDLLKNFVIENFMPAASEVLKQYLDQFVANAAKMTAVGIGVLFVVAMMLISSIDQALNYIWRVKEKCRPLISFAIYWMVLTLGPILVGSSIAISSYMASLTALQGGALNDLTQLFLHWLPVVMSTCAFLGLYLLVPNCKVRFRHALIGAITASILFESSKRGFALYIAHFPTYQLIYGALAVIPILFIWVYLCWGIVLLGAQITASLGERNHWDPKLTEKPWLSLTDDDFDFEEPNPVTNKKERKK